MRNLVITQSGLSLLAGYLSATSASAAPEPPRYVGIGSGMTPVGPTMMTVPGFEIYRTPVTGRTVIDGAVSYLCYLDIDDQTSTPSGIAGMSVSAYGLIAGDATLQSGTGTTIALANPPRVYNKNATITASPQFTINLSGIITQGAQQLIPTSGCFDLMRQYLTSPKASDGPAPPSYVVFGTVGVSGGHFATNVPGWEIYRAPIINRVHAWQGSQSIWSFLVPSGDAANLTLRTMGIMAGNATAASGTGTLIAVGYFPSPIVKTAFMLVSGNLALTVSGTLV